jgi:CubicO group peptidase (beta-lactamase class C family)
MMSGRLLSRETRQKLWSDRAEIPGVGDYAYGFGSFAGNVLIVGHGGLRGGAAADTFIVPEEGWSVTVLSNYDPPAAFVISTAARLSLARHESPQTACAAARRMMPGAR